MNHDGGNTMSEEKDTSNENQNEPHAKLNAEQIKDKLKDLGVMQDENAAPKSKESSFLKGKWPVIVAVVAALILWWWVTGTEQPTEELVSDESQQQVTSIPQSLPGEASQPAGPSPYGTMPPPPTYPQVARDADGRWAPPPPSPGSMPESQWNEPVSRSDDRFGPPPGYGAYPPPQWPGYYGPPPGYGYGPGYYGPAPGWGGYYPPPMYYGPPTGYRPGY